MRKKEKGSILRGLFYDLQDLFSQDVYLTGGDSFDAFDLRHTAGFGGNDRDLSCGGFYQAAGPVFDKGRKNDQACVIEPAVSCRALLGIKALPEIGVLDLRPDGDKRYIKPAQSFAELISALAPDGRRRKDDLWTVPVWRLRGVHAPAFSTPAIPPFRQREMQCRNAA